MKNPTPPWPMRAVTVTRPTVVTAAIRIPATMTGSARGSSISKKSRRRPYPMPIAASRTAGSTPSMPATMLRTRISSV